ncbi:putative mucin TcMUCII [Trypanosoma cruzi]|nr:putative mucin TcMUCII [Trypanosoma cruzi]
MMMTCRLLCALLVLALCCCPSVCASEDKSQAATSSQTTTTKPTTKAPVPDEKSMPESNTNSVSLPSLPPAAQPQETGQSGSSSNGAAAEHGNTAGDAGSSPGPHPQSSGAHNTVQREGTEDTSGTKSGTSTSTEHANKNVDDPAETTTTTTRAPTTTTTTTTAPEAPTTTTTEAPTTTTTRAPSRLREMDGSLSSSAWVCAPLVLAASALAYTALG